MSRKQKIFLLIIIDSFLILLANVLADLFLLPFVHPSTNFVWQMTFFQVFFYIVFATIFKVFHRINRYTSLKEMVAIFISTTGSSLFLFILMGFLQQEKFSHRFAVLTYFLTTFFIISSRLAWRILMEKQTSQECKSSKMKRTLIIGAGAAGNLLLNSILYSSKNDIKVIGLVDDDANKVGTYFSGFKVLGTSQELPKLIEKYQIQMVTVAIPSISREDYERIIKITKPLGISLTTLPFIEELANGNISVSKLKEVDVVDVLGRDEIKLNMEEISDELNGKTILVTGAGGSIGSEITRQLMRFSPKKILLLGHGENSIYQIHRELVTTYKEKNTEFVPIIADIQDRERLEDVMKLHHPNIIYHAAAHKHVPMMQCNPTEAVKNNIYGTRNVAEVAKENGVEKFVMISTDKAVNPPNVMGATKRVAEMIVTSLNEPGKTKFVAVRFGNVLGSRGSVIPLFKEQIAKGGPVTITDFRMTRYFMTIPEASRLVIQAGALAQGGEIFILDMGEPVKIVDLAKKMIELSGYQEGEIPIVESGIRPGEKLYETLLVDKEKNQEQVHEKIFVGSVHGFSLQEIDNFVKQLPYHDEELLTQELLDFARDSSK